LACGNPHDSRHAAQSANRWAEVADWWQAVDMSVVKINAIEVPAGAGPELEARFAARAGMVDQQPGFEEFMLLRPVAGEDRYFVLTRWESEQAFQQWRNGQAFQHQHRETHDENGKGAAKPQHPVATGASLLEFEVVTVSTGY
jgi:heme-degrading monooxygenase HmoA